MRKGLYDDVPWLPRNLATLLDRKRKEKNQKGREEEESTRRARNTTISARIVERRKEGEGEKEVEIGRVATANLCPTVLSFCWIFIDQIMRGEKKKERKEGGKGNKTENPSFLTSLSSLCVDERRGGLRRGKLYSLLPDSQS